MTKLSDHIRQQGSGALGRQTWPVDPRPRIVPHDKHPARSAAKQALRVAGPASLATRTPRPLARPSGHGLFLCPQ